MILNHGIKIMFQNDIKNMILCSCHKSVFVAWIHEHSHKQRFMTLTGHQALMLQDHLSISVIN